MEVNYEGCDIRFVNLVMDLGQSVVLSNCISAQAMEWRTATLYNRSLDYKVEDRCCPSYNLIQFSWKVFSLE